MEDKGRIVVIRPEKPMEVDRIETDIKKLTDLYEEGYVLSLIHISELWAAKNSNSVAASGKMFIIASFQVFSLLYFWGFQAYEATL